MLKPVRLIPALILLMLAALSSVGQTNTSGIGGRVADSKDATIPGVTTTVTNEATGLSQTQTPTDVGIYAFSSLPVETYTVRVEQADVRNSKG